MIQSFLMREFGEWTADAHCLEPRALGSGELPHEGVWRPSPWQDAEADEGDTFFVVVHRTSRSGTMKKLHVKLTRRNR